MIKGTKKRNLTIDYLLSKVSEYEIYRYYVGHDFVLGRTFCSPFRKETDPSFSIIVSKSGKLHHLDYGDSSKRGDCIDFVRQLYMGMDYNTALRLVYRDFGLLDSQGECREKVIVEVPDKEETLFQVKTKKYNAAELKFWEDYHITLDELKAHNIYAVKKFAIDKEVIPFGSHEVVFGYFVPELEKWKIYRPYALEKKYKWRTNIPPTYIHGLDRIINNCEKGVITKAKKDEIVLAKFLPNVASVQSENEICISKEHIQLITSTCKLTYLNFDSDDVGVQACKYYNQFGFKWVNCPRGYTTPEGKMIKDFADLAKYHGLETVINHFKQKGII